MTTVKILGNHRLLINMMKHIPRHQCQLLGNTPPGYTSSPALLHTIHNYNKRNDQSLNLIAKAHSIEVTTRSSLCGTQTYKKPCKNVKVLYDGKCPICVQEIKLLKWKAGNKHDIIWVDITQPDYDPNENGNIDYKTAMSVMHVIDKDGKVHNNIDAFKVMYNAVGLNWVWTFTNLPGMQQLSTKAYDWFARNRLWLTGRKSDECEDGHCSPKLRNKNMD